MTLNSLIPLLFSLRQSLPEEFDLIILRLDLTDGWEDRGHWRG
jgi:hypothetical protein